MKMENPYRGPEPFSETDVDLFFGRQTDVERLRGLLRTERIVILHARSGAGKTSLIHAGLVPRVGENGDGFKVLSPIRVNRPPPAESHSSRYIYSVICSIEEALARASGAAAPPDYQVLAGISLGTYFELRSGLREPGRPLLLIFDQFEEVFTEILYDRQGRLQFFRELGEVLADKTVWALFALKEEYVGSLDSYSRLVPTQFAARYHLDLLTREGARQAIEEPAKRSGRTFDAEAANELLDDLLRDLATPRGRRTNITGVEQARADEDTACIDPLHLQLICSKLWSFLGGKTERVTASDVQKFVQALNAESPSVVDAVLISYFDEEVRNVAGVDSPNERLIREWVESTLIKEGRFRALAQAETDERSFLGTAQRRLDQRHILRASIGGGGGETYYELAHDRLVGAVRRSNERWYQRHRSRFIRNARQWWSQGKPESFEALSLGNCTEMAPESKWESAYKAFCEEKWQKQRNKDRMKKLKLSLGAVSFLLLGFLVYGLYLQLTNAKLVKDNAKIVEDKEHFEKSIIEMKAEKKQMEDEKKESAEAIRKLAKQRKELEGDIKKLTQETEDQRNLALIRQLSARAMQQSFVDRNHDVALLLGRYARILNDNIQDSALKVSNLYLDGLVLGMLGRLTRELSRTFPAPALGGEPGNLTGGDSRVRILVGTPGGPMVTELDLKGDTVARGRACSAAPQAYSPDGRYLAAVEGEEVRLRETGNCVDVSKFNPPRGASFAANPPVFGNDGYHLAAFLTDGRLAVYDTRATDGQPLSVIEEGDRSCGEQKSTSYRNSTVTLESNMVVVGDTGGGIRVFELADGKLTLRDNIRTWDTYPFKLLGKGYCTKPDNQYASIIALHLDKAPKKCITVVYKGGLQVGGGRILRWCREGRQLVGLPPFLPEEKSRDGNSRNPRGLVDNPSAELFLSAHFSEEGNWLVTGGDQFTVTRWNLEQPIPGNLSSDELSCGPVRQDNPPIPRAPVTCYAVSRDFLSGMVGAAQAVYGMAQGAIIAAIDSTSVVRTWVIGRPAENYKKERGNSDTYYYDLAFHPEYGLLAGPNKGPLEIWGKVDRQPLRATIKNLHKIPEGIRSFDIHGDFTVVGLRDRTVLLSRLGKTPEPEPSKLQAPAGAQNHTDGLWSTRFRPNNPHFDARFDLATADSKRVLLWELAPGTDGTPIPSGPTVACKFPKGVHSLAFHPDGRWLLVANRGTTNNPNGRLDMIDIEGRMCAEESREICSGVSDGPCVAWSLSPGHLDSLPALYSVAFSDDGTRFAVGGNDGTVRWWEFNGDKTPLVWDRGNPIKGAKGRINAVLFQPGDSSILAAAGLEGNVRFWSLKQDFFNEPLVLQAGTPIESLALHHDGNLVVAGDGRGQLHLWDLDVADAACRVALRNLTCQEWLENVGQKPYQPICPKLGYPACEGSAEAVGDLGYSITP